MLNAWNEVEATRANAPLALLAYASRLLGRDDTLVLHGGGNTSLKLGGVLHVKGTGRDLASVDESAFTPLDLARSRAVLDADPADNAAMRALLAPCVTQHPAPAPSIETLMHASLPHACVMHTHAYDVLAALNIASIEAVHAQVFGKLAPLVPYRHSGHALARACMEAYAKHATSDTIGLMLAYHGIVSFGDGVRAAYDNMLALVTRAEAWLKSRSAWALPDSGACATAPGPSDKLLHDINAAAGKPLVCKIVNSALTRAYAARQIGRAHV